MKPRINTSSVAHRSGHFLPFLMFARFSSSTPICNVFCSEVAVLAAKWHSVRRCFVLALEKTATILGETEHFVASSLPKDGRFEGRLIVNGKEKNCTVQFNASMGFYPEVW